MSLEKKIETIKSFSIDYLVILKFDTNLMNMDAEAFLKKILIKNLSPIHSLREKSYIWP